MGTVYMMHRDFMKKAEAAQIAHELQFVSTVLGPSEKKTMKAETCYVSCYFSTD